MSMSLVILETATAVMPRDCHHVRGDQGEEVLEMMALAVGSYGDNHERSWRTRYFFSADLTGLGFRRRKFFVMWTFIYAILLLSSNSGLGK